MSYRALIVLALAAACGDDTASTSFGGGTSTGEPGTTGPTTAEPTTAEPTTAGPTTGPTTATTATTSTGTTTTTGTDATGTGTSSGTDVTGDPSGTTGHVGLCGVDGETVHAELVDVGAPDPCGTLEFTGQLASDPKGPAWMLDACPCGANCLKPDPWTFTMIAPDDWLPVLPVCPRIVVDRQMGFGGCEFVAVSIWDAQAVDLPAFFHAGHGFQPTQAAAKELSLTTTSVQTCDCDFCCTDPELWDITFTHLGAQATVAEGQTAALGKFTAADFESHSNGVCDAPLDAHWAVRQGP